MSAKREWIIHLRLTDRQSSHCQQEFILVLRHKKIENMNDSSRFYTDSAILIRALEFPINLYGLKRAFLHFNAY